MDHDELRVVCDSYEGLWRVLLSAQTNTYTTYVVHETENTTVPWAILGVTNDGHTLRVTPLDMARISVGVSFCFRENTPLTQGVFSNMLKLAEHAVREKLK